jgi:DNA primase
MTWFQDLIGFSISQLSDREIEVLLSRGVSEDQIQLFQVGYLNKVLPQGMPKEFLSWSKKGLKLDDVFVFPLTTACGEVQGLQFRHVIRERTGYMDYFLGSCEPCLFGLHQAVKAMWETQSVYLVEGVFDLFPIQRAVPFVVSTITSYTTQETVRLLKRFVKRVWLGYDMDEPGRKGCSSFQFRYGKDFDVRIVSYPRVEGKTIKDPGDLWEARGDSYMVPFIQKEVSFNASFI